MQNDQIKERLLEHFPDSTVEVSGDGRHFDLRIVSASFDGMRSVRRQQSVYAAINDWIRDGAVHAVNIKALTPDEQ